MAKAAAAAAVPGKSVEPEAAAVWAALDSLKGWPKNPRKNDKTIPRVAELIKEYGWGRPVGARTQNGELIWGHSACGAAHLLGRQWKTTSEDGRKKWHPDAVRVATKREVPCRFRDDLDERRAHDLAVADNKSQELSEWDDSMLAEHLQQATLREAELMCFTTDSLQDLLNAADESSSEEDGGRKLTDGLSYSVVVECAGEAEQAALIEQLEAQGLTCKPLIT
jgi:hypothetical protein